VVSHLAWAEVLVAGEGQGPTLRLTAPLSFWGGVDAASGRLVDPRHPQQGVFLAGRVLLLLAGTAGSSSSSSVLLELIAGGRAPAALILAQADAILALGAVVAREMGLSPPPVLRLDAAHRPA
jgi:predicted aconitase with swiveling domain